MVPPVEGAGRDACTFWAFAEKELAESVTLENGRSTSRCATVRLLPAASRARRSAETSRNTQDRRRAARPVHSRGEPRRREAFSHLHLRPGAA